MQSAFKEVVEKKQKPFWQILFFILAGVVLVNILITACNLLGEKYAGIASVVILITSIIICSRIIIKYLSSYRYRYVDDVLVFERIIGKKTKIVLQISIDEIDSIKPYEEVEKAEDVRYTYKFICDKQYNNFYVGEFTKNYKKYRFIFKPSQRFINLIISKKTQS